MSRKILIALFVLFASVFVFSAVSLGINIQRQHKQSKQRDMLTAIAEGRTEDKQNNPNSSNTNTNTSNGTNISEPLTEEEQLENYLLLKEINNDFVGWLSIEGTTLNYPVVQSKDRPNFYLDHDFFKNANAYGTLYVSENCELFNNPSDNIIIHGHHMRDKEMFGILDKYRDKSFYSEHSQIQFNTLIKPAVYDVIGFFEIDLTNDNFQYYNYVEGNEENFDSYINDVRRRSLYETDKAAVYGKQLLTLSTCHNYKSNVRLVLVAQLNDL